MSKNIDEPKVKRKEITKLEVKKTILKMKNNKSGDRSRWKAESHYNRDSNKVTIQKWWIKGKSSGKPERYIHNKYSVQNI